MLTVIFIFSLQLSFQQFELQKYAFCSTEKEFKKQSLTISSTQNVIFNAGTLNDNVCRKFIIIIMIIL